MSDKDAVFRIDSFVVPAEGRAEFLERIRETHAILKHQPGFIRDEVLEQTVGAGSSRIVTIAEWRDMEAVRAAKTAVEAARAGSGFDPQALMERLGITADMGNYQRVEGAA